jgi:acetolactate synthase I/II/III large subunit
MLVEAVGKGRGPGAGRAAAAAARAGKAAQFAKLSGSEERPIRPERLVAALQAALPEDAVVVADPGTPCPYLSGYYTWRRAGRHFLTNRAHGALGYALPASLGAWYGRPEKKICAVMGDGSFGFAVGELETLVRSRAPILMVVVSNAVYGWIKASQRASYGGRYYSVDFSATDHARVAEAYGVRSWRVEDPAALEATLRRAAAHGGPTLVDVVCQPLQEAAAPVSQWMG